MATTKNRKSPKAEKPIDGILLQVTPAGDDQTLNIQVLGSVKQTEVPTLLRLGAKLAEKNLGIERG